MIKQLQTSFDFMGRPENAANAILFVMCFALFFIIIGVGLAWVASLLITKKVTGHYSFDDFIDHTNRQSKIRRVK